MLWGILYRKWLNRPQIVSKVVEDAGSRDPSFNTVKIHPCHVLWPIFSFRFDAHSEILASEVRQFFAQQVLILGHGRCKHRTQDSEKKHNTSVNYNLAVNVDSVTFSKHGTPFTFIYWHLKDVTEISYLRADARLPPSFVPLCGGT